MSNISTAFDTIVTKMGTLFPSHTRQTNPHDISDNTELNLKQSWGIRLGPATNTERNVSCLLSIQRDIVIILTRQMFANELNRTGRSAVEKTLLEDQFIMIKDFEKDPTLGNSDVFTKFGLESDNGIEFVFDGENERFLKLETTFSFEYFENLNT